MLACTEMAIESTQLKQSIYLYIFVIKFVQIQFNVIFYDFFYTMLRYIIISIYFIISFKF